MGRGVWIVQLRTQRPSWLFRSIWRRRSKPTEPACYVPQDRMQQSSRTKRLVAGFFENDKNELGVSKIPSSLGEALRFPSIIILGNQEKKCAKKSGGWLWWTPFVLYDAYVHAWVVVSNICFFKYVFFFRWKTFILSRKKFLRKVSQAPWSNMM